MASKVLTQNDLLNVLAHINLGDDGHMELTQAEFDQLTQEEKDDGTIYFITDGVSGNVFLDDNTPIGTIAPYGGTSDPTYWLICDGRAISRTAYADLFAVIGTTYGTGDGSTTFNIPDLRGNVAVGASATYNLGDTGGEAEHTLTIDEMPSHKHEVSYRLNVVAQGTAGMWYFDAGTVGTMTTDTPSVANTGGSQAHNNMQPYVVTNYIIKYSSAISQNQSQLDFTYPVGSYYETNNENFNPNTHWSGTWELVDEYELVAWASVINNVITASHNMSITGLGGTTYYTITFTKPMANIDYLVSASGEANGIGSEILGVYQKTTNGFYFDHANYSGTAVVLTHFTITVFGKLAEPEHFKWHRIA